MLEKIHNKGKRDNNEDYLLFDDEKNIYIVCDGVGGSNKGEEASKLAANSFLNYFDKNIEIDIENLKKALKFTESKFDEFIAENPESQGMATTLTFLHLIGKKAILAHCGDSRIYQIRNGEIIFKTKDHSFVQELVDSGYITPEAALIHPKKNRITRAIQGTEKFTALDIQTIEDVQENDYFILCSDGILESISDDYLKEKFNSYSNLSEMRKEIEMLCSEKSNDNFTAIFIKIENEKIELINNENEEIDVVKSKTSNIYKYLSFLLVTVLAATGIWFYLDQKKTQSKSFSSDDKYLIDSTANNKVIANQYKTSATKETIKIQEAQYIENLPKKKNDIEEGNWKSEFYAQLKHIDSKKIPAKDKLIALITLERTIKDYSNNTKEMDLIVQKRDEINKIMISQKIKIDSSNRKPKPSSKIINSKNDSLPNNINSKNK